MIFCKSTIDVRKSKTKFCSKSCLSEGKKEGLTTWGFINEGKKHGNNARKRIFINGKYFYLHRLIMEEYLGRKLLSSEIVHHINGDPKDNRLENLMITTNTEHGKIHKPKRSISS